MLKEILVNFGELHLAIDLLEKTKEITDLLLHGGYFSDTLKRDKFLDDLVEHLQSLKSTKG